MVAHQQQHGVRQVRDRARLDRAKRRLVLLEPASSRAALRPNWA